MGDSGAVWVATTIFRNEPRWREDDGSVNIDTMVDGVGVSEAAARAFSRHCSNEELRWYRSSRTARATAAHRGRNRVHFHRVEREHVVTMVGDDGWPVTVTR